MVKLREIQRTAAFAWSPVSTWIATGTKSGAVDVDFSNETCIELWDLSLDQPGSSQELQPKASVTTETGFHDLAWTPPTAAHPKGIIAGALDDGTLILWDAEKLETDSANASIYSKKVHSGAIKSLQYNPHPKFSNFLATGGAKGELFIHDLNDLESEPIRLGSTAARADDIDCLDWNKKVPNILVTGSSGGFVTVWDLKTKKESLTLNNFGRKAVSAIAWDPEKPTRLITAVPSEQEPVILVWDLRNSNAPEKVLRGHDDGVLSLSWCPQDNELLLSCGKDNRTILWNPQTGQAYGDYPVVTNWTFQTRWCPKNPSIFATASFDGRLSIQTLQNTNPSAAQQEQNHAGNDEDFFSKAQTQPQTSSFSLLRAPKWLERPASVSFGFGGRVISVRIAEAGKRTSKVSITKFEVDSEVGAATNTFEEALQSGNLDDLCDSRAAESKSDEEKADWQVMKTLLSKQPRKELVKYLGFDESAEAQAADQLSKLGLEDKSANGEDQKSQVNGSSGPSKAHRRFDSVFATDADGDFLSQLAATKGTTTNNPFQIFNGSESEADRRITKLVMLGKFDKALDICLAEERMSDAFMLAICGGEACIKRAQEAYFAKQGSGPNYLRLLASVVGKNLWDTVHNADLENWQGVMATLCTFADEKEFPDLCEALGDRLEGQAARKDAAFCYLAGSKLEKVISIWISDLKQHEEEGAANAAESSAFSVHAKALQDLIEKVTIFRRVVDFQDTELQKTSDWKLEALYNKYLEYADIVAAHGQLDAAAKYLSLLPVQYPEADVARGRIQQATKKAVMPTARQPASATTATPKKPLPGVSALPMNNFSPTGAPVPTPFQQQPPTQATPSYNPPGQSSYAQPGQSSFTPSNPYQPMAPPSNPYAPQRAQTGYQPTQPMRANLPPPPQQFGMHAPPSQFGAPPRNITSSPSVPPPSQAKDMKAWNDLPDDFAKAPTPRRNTPSVPPQLAQPQNHFYNGASPPGSSGTPFGQRPTKAVPPPPKAGELPQRVQSPQISGAQIQRPSSTAQNAYAPLQQQQSASSLPMPMQPPVARGASPFTAPPSGAPPPNRYAPAPGSQPMSQGPPAQRIISPPPQASQFQGPLPASNPYAPGQAQNRNVSNPYAPTPPPQQQNFGQPPPAQSRPPVGPPPSGPPRQQELPRPGTSGSASGNPPAALQQAKKHPKGDRSHIPADAQPIFHILSAEFSRIEARAPAQYAPQVKDTGKRLQILFDHLNNEDLLKPDTVAQMVELARCVESKDWDRAAQLQLDIQVNKVDESGQWMVGVKRLIGMGRATNG
ncbi:protein transport protein S31 [Lithohypha guttulata]|uniref:Protein transport protein SEC31 n=1 Tax=Lithohypha guttulata TaxID=1690604 RepID=A0AAN7Y3R8_9EURO|nr:protein transport protein S31 [Lithohypha guttulata]